MLFCAICRSQLRSLRRKAAPCAGRGIWRKTAALNGYCDRSLRWSGHLAQNSCAQRGAKRLFAASDEVRKRPKGRKITMAMCFEEKELG